MIDFERLWKIRHWYKDLQFQELLPQIEIFVMFLTRESHTMCGGLLCGVGPGDSYEGKVIQRLDISSPTLTVHCTHCTHTLPLLDIEWPWHSQRQLCAVELSLWDFWLDSRQVCNDANWSSLYCTLYCTVHYTLGRFVAMRTDHLCWELDNGDVMLLGGQYSPKTTELMDPKGRSSVKRFTLQYKTV